MSCIHTLKHRRETNRERNLIWLGYIYIFFFLRSQVNLRICIPVKQIGTTMVVAMYAGNISVIGSLIYVKKTL